MKLFEKTQRLLAHICVCYLFVCFFNSYFRTQFARKFCRLLRRFVEFFISSARVYALFRYLFFQLVFFFFWFFNGNLWRIHLFLSFFVHPLKSQQNKNQKFQTKNEITVMFCNAICFSAHKWNDEFVLIVL